MLAFGSLILEVSGIVLHDIKLHYSHLHLKTDGQSGLKGNQLSNLRSQTKTVREQEHGSGLAVLIFMKNSPWDIRLLSYPRYKKFMVDLEQPLGGNMTKALNFIRIKLPKSIQIRFFSLNLDLISVNRKAGKREKQACPSNTGKTRPPCST